MTKKGHIFLIYLALAFCGMVFAQERLVSKANEKYQYYSFSPTIDIYKRVIEKGFVSADLLKKLGNSYYFNADYREAADTYKKLVTEYPSDVGPDYYFRYAQTLKSLGDYDAANTIMGKFSEMSSSDRITSAYKSEKDYLAEIKKNSG